MVRPRRLYPGELLFRLTRNRFRAFLHSPQRLASILEAAGFVRDLALANIRDVAPQAVVFEVSARTGAGLADWYAFLEGHAARYGNH